MPPVSRALPLAVAALLLAPPLAHARDGHGLVAESRQAGSGALPAPASAATTEPSVTAHAAATWAESKIGARECGAEQATWTAAYEHPCDAAWCGEFVGMAYRAAGHDLGPDVWGMTSLYDAVRAGQRYRSVPPEDAQRGDLVLMYLDADQARPVTHVALATGPMVDGEIPTVDGNANDAVMRATASPARRVGGRSEVVLVGRVRTG